jgi:lysophospholipase L1-like esterase
MKSVYVIGDSISLEYGPFLKQMLGGEWRYSRKDGEQEALLNLDNPCGANGGDSAMVLAFLTGLRQRGGFRVDVMLVNCGLHDIKRDRTTAQWAVDAESYRQNLGAMVDVVGDLAGQMVWVTTTPVDDELHRQRRVGFDRRQADVLAYRRIAAEVMAARKVPVLDLGGFTDRLGSGRAIYRDGVHFQPPIPQQQAAYIAGWLEHWRAEKSPGA